MASPHELFSAVVRDRSVGLEPARRFGPHPRHCADVWRPRRREADRVAMFLYGGSWRSGRRTSYAFAGAALAGRGITCVVPDYRLYPETRFPGFVEDAALAYAWTVREVAGDRPVVVIGHSAGAHIAALLALAPRYLEAAGMATARPAGLVGISGPYTFDPTSWPTTAEIFATAPTADAARPIALVGPDAPPALLVHGGADAVVNPKAAREMAAALQVQGARAELDIRERMGHIAPLLALTRPLRWASGVLDGIERFVRGL